MPVSRFSKLTAALIALLLFSACSGSPSTTSSSRPGTTAAAEPSTVASPTAESTPKVTSTPKPTSESVTSSSTPRLTVEGSGANAAPTAAGGYSGPYDASQQAETNFGLWMDYEYQSGSNWRETYEAHYNDGVTLVCANRALGYSATQIVKYLSKDKGYNSTAAAALVASSFRALCPKADEFRTTVTSLGGYKTYFDETVDRAYKDVTTSRQLTFSGSKPTLYDVGWFGKYVCFYLAENDNGGGLIEYLYMYKDINPNGSTYLSGSNQRTVEILVTLVANVMCYGSATKLGPAWYE